MSLSLPYHSRAMKQWDLRTTEKCRRFGKPEHPRHLLECAATLATTIRKYKAALFGRMDVTARNCPSGRKVSPRRSCVLEVAPVAPLTGLLGPQSSNKDVGTRRAYWLTRTVSRMASSALGIGATSILEVL